MIAGTSAVEGALNAIPEVITRGLQIAGGFIVVVGYAMVINMMEAKALMPFFFLGFVIAAFTEFNLVGLGILGLCLAILYIQLNPKYHAFIALPSGGNGGGASFADEADDELEGL